MQTKILKDRPTLFGGGGRKYLGRQLPPCPMLTTGLVVTCPSPHFYTWRTPCFHLMHTPLGRRRGRRRQDQREARLVRSDVVQESLVLVLFAHEHVVVQTNGGRPVEHPFTSREIVCTSLQAQAHNTILVAQREKQRGTRTGQMAYESVRSQL